MLAVHLCTTAVQYSVSYYVSPHIVLPTCTFIIQEVLLYKEYFTFASYYQDNYLKWLALVHLSLLKSGLKYYLML
jgi:ABC-type sulfate transport system permease subunit